MPTHNPTEFYATPHAFTRWLFDVVPISGALYEPCVGAGDIPAAIDGTWRTNDLDPYWEADTQYDATTRVAWPAGVEWTVTNPPFSLAVPILEHALAHSAVGVAMFLRLSFHEPLKTGARHTFLREHPPTDILFLPRFAFQRSPKTGKWTTDSMTSCWVTWVRDTRGQALHYPPRELFEQLEAETPEYRRRMDAYNFDRFDKRTFFL